MSLSILFNSFSFEVSLTPPSSADLITLAIDAFEAALANSSASSATGSIAWAVFILAKSLVTWAASPALPALSSLPTLTTDLGAAASPTVPISITLSTGFSTSLFIDNSNACWGEISPLTALESIFGDMKE